MGLWLHRIKVKHLMTDDEDRASVQASMNAIADALEKSKLFPPTLVKSMRNIPEGDDDFGPIEYANKRIERMYDHADANNIWIE